MPNLRKIGKLSKEVKEELDRVERLQEDITKQFRMTLLTILGTAFGLVAAFFWRDAISETIDLIVPPGESLLYKYLAAFVVTILMVFVLYVATKFLKKEEKGKKRKV